MTKKIMNPQDIKVEVASGTSYVCAMCERYWQGRALGLDRCTAPAECGSPLIGDNFTHYVGPLKDFREYCFVCGKVSTHSITVNGRIRKIGACPDHMKWLEEAANKKRSREEAELIQMGSTEVFEE